MIDYFNAHNIKRRTSLNEKKKNNFSRQKDIIDTLDFSYYTERNTDLIQKYDINYDLFNGRVDKDLYSDPICFNIGDEEIKLDYERITHYPLISQICRAMSGEIKNKPFSPHVKHIGTLATNMRKKQWNDLLKRLLNEQGVLPIQQLFTAHYLQQLGISDQFSLTPDQIQQVQSDIQARVNKRTPKDILDFMQNDFQTPTERQASQFLNYILERYDIKKIFDEGGKHAIITGVEYYYIGEQNGYPVLEFVNPKYFKWGGSQNTVDVQNGTWARYEQWHTCQDLYLKYASDLEENVFIKLESTF